MASKKRTWFARYWWVFAGVLSAVAVSTALNISNTDSWIVVTNPSNDTWIVNWNTSRPTICASGNYSYWTGTGFACAPDQSGIANLSGYVPYTGATQNVNINGFILQSHGVRSTDSAGLLLESSSGTDSAVFGVANTANILFYGSLDMNTGTNICLSGVCRGSWPADTYANVTTLQARVDSLNNTKLNATDQRYNDTAAINTVSTFAQTKAATGSATSASLCLQNLTVTNNTWTSAYTSCGGAGGGVTTVNTGNGLTGGPITSTGTISINATTCGASEYSYWTGTAWACRTDQTGGGSGTNFATYNATVHDLTDSAGAATFVNLPNATLYLSASSTYTIECGFLVNAAATTTGVQLRFNTTGTPTNVRYNMDYYTSATAQANCQGTSTSSNTCSATASAGTTVTQSRYLGFVRTGANPSIFTVDFATEVDLSAATVYAGSYCRAVKTT